VTLPKRSIAVVAFAVGLLLAGATAYGVGSSLQEQGSGTVTVDTVNYGSN